MKDFKPEIDWYSNSPRLSKKEVEGYIVASELVKKQILEIDSSAKSLVYPYCYLIRNYIEIRLKEIIEEGNKITKPAIVFQEGHDLKKLWLKSQEILKEVWQDQFEATPEEVSEFIKSFHYIDVNSDSFRYPVAGNGVESINFEYITEAFQNFKYYLDGVTDSFRARKEN